MATRAQNLSSPVSQRLRKLGQSLRMLFAPGDASALLIVLALLLMPALSLQAAGWPMDMRTILPVTLLGLLFGFLLARSHYNELFALIMSGIYGAGFVLLIAAINEPGGIGEGIASLFTRLFTWLTDAVSGGINQDNAVFTMLVAALMWFLAYSAAWHVFRIDRIWRAILPPGMILVMNNIYYTGRNNLDGYLIVFIFMSLLLVVRSNLDAREWDWYVNGIRVPRNLRKQFLRMGALLALVALLGAWLIPTGNLQRQLDRFQEFLQSDPLTQLSEFWSRLFSTGETQGPTTADYYGGDSLQLGGAIRLGDQVVFTVAAPPGRRYYWRSRIFDTYENGRWLPAANTRLTDPQSPLEVIDEPYVEGSRTPLEQTFTVGQSATRLVYTAPQPSRVDLPTRTDLRYIDVDSQRMNVSVIRPMSVLNQGDRYTALSLLSSATAAQLRSASADYPAWVRELYLYVSPSITDRTYELARQIAAQAGTATPYDQARAVETWLRANILYNESIPQPPQGRDPVDWLLFDLRQGYCNYYASAMVMMLRVLGIPARMAAGFSQGTWNAELQQFVVLERDAHTWVEAYFPGYGWVEFEPTAAQAPLNRVDDVEIALQPSATPIASPPPTQTPSPTPSPTQDISVPPQNSEGRTLPTVTPTLTPTPTATPVIVPTQPPPLQEQRQEGPLSFVMPIIGAVLAALMIVLLLAGAVIFIWWWWEWRGMRGLSPISRAYARLERYVPLIGIRLAEQETPDERRQRIVHKLPPAEPPISAITNMYTAERYGPRAQHPREVEIQAEAAEHAWSDTRTSILKRWLARRLPWNRR